MSPARHRIGVLSALGASMIWSAPAAAQNLRDVPLGGRTAAMGGVAQASGSDGAMPLLNPAGLAAAPKELLSISATAYGYWQSSADKYFTPDGLDPALGDVRPREDQPTFSKLSIIPTTLSYIKT